VSFTRRTTKSRDSGICGIAPLRTERAKMGHPRMLPFDAINGIRLLFFATVSCPALCSCARI